MFQPHTIRRAVAVLAIATVPVLMAARQETASRMSPAPRFHLALKRAEPGMNDTIASSPKTLKLWFTESVTPAGTGIRVTGPQDHTVMIGAISVESAPLSPAVVSVSEPLAPGTYTVAWRAMADDGHPSMGKFSFTIRSTESR